VDQAVVDLDRALSINLRAGAVRDAAMVRRGCAASVCDGPDHGDEDGCPAGVGCGTAAYGVVSSTKLVRLSVTPRVRVAALGGTRGSLSQGPHDGVGVEHLPRAASIMVNAGALCLSAWGS
jgi:hypothetical protein